MREFVLFLHISSAILLVSGLYLAHLSRLRWSHAVWLPLSLGMFLLVAGVWHGSPAPGSTRARSSSL